ncbi:hypothetical protein Cni_G22892 [Canna indica]|uniref:Uncharacterized protein n=1 Tax=Canna indica TaxID=4628 RepID=A0AAQ3KS38_9LILI|nr:hypothetical protein Cni_G22892 [Canna indica]
MLCTFYSLPIVHPDSLLVITISGIGLALETFYLTIFILHSTREGRLKILAAEILFVVVVFIAVLLTAHTY